MVIDRKRLGLLTRAEASVLLRSRLMAIGALFGGVMGIIWVFVALVIVPGFPDAGSPPFLVITFLSVILLAASGAYAGRRAWRKNVSGSAK
jgi:apolipoprotein N-acyltransferase